MYYLYVNTQTNYITDIVMKVVEINIVPGRIIKKKISNTRNTYK